MKRIITEKILSGFQNYLYQEEKSPATIQKYMRDLKKLQTYVGREDLTKNKLIAYKKMLKNSKKYKLSSINSYLSAINCFFDYMGWYDLKLKTFRIQKEVFVPEYRNLTKEEYKKLVHTAEKLQKGRLALILETLCSTGIRVSELSELTVADIKQGSANIYCKGKARQILLPQELQKKLLFYTAKNNIHTGPVFQTANHHPIDRSNIWREMKSLCAKAGVDPQKVFPHNLRHLFAKIFYEIQKDIAKLADILGHNNIETTRIYIKNTGYEHRIQIETMGLVLTPCTNTT